MGLDGWNIQAREKLAKILSDKDGDTAQTRQEFGTLMRQGRVSRLMLTSTEFAKIALLAPEKVVAVEEGRAGKEDIMTYWIYLSRATGRFYKGG